MGPRGERQSSATWDDLAECALLRRPAQLRLGRGDAISNSGSNVFKPARRHFRFHPTSAPYPSMHGQRRRHASGLAILSTAARKIRDLQAALTTTWSTLKNTTKTCLIWRCGAPRGARLPLTAPTRSRTIAGEAASPGSRRRTDRWPANAGAGLGRDQEAGRRPAWTSGRRPAACIVALQGARPVRHAPGGDLTKLHYAKRTQKALDRQQAEVVGRGPNTADFGPFGNVWPVNIMSQLMNESSGLVRRNVFDVN